MSTIEAGIGAEDDSESDVEVEVEVVEVGEEREEVDEVQADCGVETSSSRARSQAGRSHLALTIGPALGSSSLSASPKREPDVATAASRESKLSTESTAAKATYGGGAPDGHSCATCPDLPHMPQLS